MCIDPNTLPTGDIVACRNCWQCRANRVNDLVGRCIAEQTTATTALAVTLTYAGDGPETAMLRYRDLQLMFKLIRRRGYQVRYIVAGEFGSKKGRAHWHAVLFFSCVGPTGPAPIPRAGNGPWDITIGQRQQWKPWPHGLVFFQEPDHGGFAYVLKYALKDQAPGSKGHLAMSKKPPLGLGYFQDMAERYVNQALAPQDLFYSFANVFDAKRRRRRFLLQGKSRELFLEWFVTRWREVYGTEPPLSEPLMDHWDRQARQFLALTESDDHWRAARTQWPKYQSPDQANSMAGEWLRQMEWDDPDLWTVAPGVIPAELWDDVPPKVLEWSANGETLVLQVHDGTPSKSEYLTAGMMVYLDADEHGEAQQWHVSEDRAPLWREWLQALALQGSGR